MSEPLRGVIVCHGALARALVDATAQISGMADGARAGVELGLRPG